MDCDWALANDSEEKLYGLVSGMRKKKIENE